MMQLFTINRYEEEHPPTETNENKKLEKLLKKVEKRKRKLEKQKQSETLDDCEEEASELKKPRHEIGTQLDLPAIEDGAAPKEIESPETSKNFQVLGDNVFEKRAEAAMVLPIWLRQPTIIVSEIATDSADLNEYTTLISPILIQNLKSQEFTKLFPVQKQVIPWILEAHSKPPPFRPRDICVSAPTGSGKTLVFALPIVQLLLNRVECKVRALVVLPATELASQVFKVFKMLCRNTQLAVGLLSTATPFEVEQRFIVERFQNKYYSKYDIIVTTPGRLVEHLHGTKGLDLKSIRFLVVDEADRIMEQSYHNWLYHLDEHLKATTESFMTGRCIPLCVDQLIDHATKQPHKMLFSATLTQDPEKLQNLRLFQPKLFTSVVKSTEEFINQLSLKVNIDKKEENAPQGEFKGKYTTPKELSEYCIVTEQRFKPLTLYTLCRQHKWRRFLCFTNTNEAAKRLAIVLNSLYGQVEKVAELSAALKPSVRKQVLKDFSKGEYVGIVCSDALSRGIDIEKVKVVISYDLPRHINTYIHRVGRTARAGQPGTGITILTPPDRKKFDKLLSSGGKEPLPEMQVDTALEEEYAKNYSIALKTLQANLEDTANLKEILKKKQRNQTSVEKGKRGVMVRLQEEIEQKMNAGKKKKSTVISM